jgi:capsular exopolysaccharide synthesis family protein
MSRIYEALRKAQEQGATSAHVEQVQRSESLIAQAAHRHRAGQGVPEFLSPIEPEGASPASCYLRLDELRQRCAKPGWRLNPDYAVFFGGHAGERCAEQFRTLRSRLYRLREKRPIRTLLITSACAGEGKSFVALNLAQAIARQHERRALLIDADLRAPSLHLRMGAPSAPGLTDYLAGEADELSIVQADAKEDLFFIPAGKSVSNPTELLANNRLKSLLGRMAPVFEWIIVDAPPVLPVSDASVLAGMCDGVIFVVRAGATAFDLAQTACQEFRENNLLGAVLNGVDEEAMYGAYSYYAGNGLDKR